MHCKAVFLNKMNEVTKAGNIVIYIYSLKYICASIDQGFQLKQIDIYITDIITDILFRHTM